MSLLGESAQLQAACELIKDATLQKFTIDILQRAPESFWTIPASSSGKHHPEQSNGEGGLVRHILACLYMARETFCMYSATEEEQDCVIAAIIMHDIGKAMNEPHDIVCAQALRYARGKSEDSLLLKTIAGVRWHMGKWSTGSTDCAYEERGPKRFPEDFTRIEQMVHLADYYASRKRVNLSKLDI